MIRCEIQCAALYGSTINVSVLSVLLEENGIVVIVRNELIIVKLMIKKFLFGFYSLPI